MFQVPSPRIASTPRPGAAAFRYVGTPTRRQSSTSTVQRGTVRPHGGPEQDRAAASQGRGPPRIRPQGAAGARAWSLDISEDSIAYARRRFPRVTFCCESMETFASRSLAFDLVFSAELLEHIPSPRPFMALLTAVTRPGAHVYISTPDAGHPVVPDRFPDWGDLQPPEHVQFFNRANLTRLFADCGFALKRAWTKRSPAHSLLFVRTPDAR